MAVYQYYMAFVPKVGLLKKLNNIPKKIAIGTESGHFQANTDKYWELAKINFLEIKLEIDRIVDKANWGNTNDSFNWKTYTEELDNDAWMGINSITEEITELSFRADLREPNLVFLNRILELANKNEMMLMDIKGNVFKPELNEVGEFIKISNCYRFFENPKKFIDDLLSERGQ